MNDDLQPMDPEEGVERFLDYRRTGWRDSTYRNAVTRLGHFLDFCEEEEIDDLNDLTGRTLSNFVAFRRPEIAPVTLQKQLTTVRVFLRWGEDIEAVPEGLSEKLHAPELPDGGASSDTVIEPHRVRHILSYLSKFDHASREHVIVALLWRTGMRRGALHSLDVDDLRPDDNALVLEHRPETDTYLKNGSAGERWIYLGSRWYQVVEDYVENKRIETTDEYGREPLLTTRNGRLHITTVTDNCYRVTRPCKTGKECPVGRDPDDCDGATDATYCPVKRGPHAFRRSAISEFLRESTPPEIVSERMNVSLDVLYQHYDVRTDQEKMEVRKDQLPNQ